MHNLNDRRLYLCVAVREDIESFLDGVLRGGVDVVQLRDKELGIEGRRSCAKLMVPICRDYGVPFIMNDSPELALAVGADGVHVGQEDVTVQRCRELLGPDAIVGLSTHARDEFDAALDQPATYFSAGPVAETPTKPGRKATGVSYAAECQTRSDRPVFVTGGVNELSIAGMVAHGLQHFVVVRALTESLNPQETARALRRALDEALSTVSVEPT